MLHLSMMSRALAVAALAWSATALAPAAAQTAPASVAMPTIDQLRASKTLRIAFDPDAPPFSYFVPGTPTTGAPLGYSVDLCRAVAEELKGQLAIPDLKVAYVAVNSTNRFDAIADNRADLLCASATASLSRRARVDFSLPIFIDGASFAIGPNGPRDVAQLAGKKVGVLPGTTTEEELRRALKATHDNAQVVLVKTNQEGIDELARGQIAAYFADRATLTFLLRKEKEAANLMMADTYLSIEPIALALRLGDGAFRLQVDTALSHLYRRGAIVQVFKGAFGPLASPSGLLAALYQISGLPD
jgi:polar amino acid transport system substrate-binding protein/glutamate/aspartate transport system substrate-binding protein